MPTYARPSRRRRFTGHKRSVEVSFADGGARHRRPYKRARRFRPGYDRSVGFYGRYNRGELKFWDLDISFAPLATNGNQHGSLNLIPAGTSESSRIGRKVVLRKISMRLRLTMPSNTGIGLSTDIIRIMIMLDKQANGANPSGILTADTWDAFNELANKNRFRTLLEKTVALNATAAAWNGSAVVVGEVSRAFNFNVDVNIPVEFNGTTGVISEIRSNNTFLYVQTLDSTNTGCVLEGVCRVRFTDA